MGYNKPLIVQLCPKSRLSSPAMTQTMQRPRSIGLSARLVIGLIAFLPALSACAPPADPPPSDARVSLVVSAAADLISAFEVLGALFTEQTGIDVTFNFGSTGQLAQQIEQGARADVFAAANESFIVELAREGHVIADTLTVYGVGRLVLWTRADSPLTFATLDDLTQAGVNRIAIANPEHAPYGIAARETLQNAALWDPLQPRLILGDNVAQAFQYAETGNVDVGIVALSLAIAAGDAGRWALIDEGFHSRLNQMAGVVSRAPHPDEARQFVAFLVSDTGRAVLRRYGFFLPGEPLILPGDDADDE